MTTDRYLPFHDALERGIAGATPALEWLVLLLDCAEEDASALYHAADRVRAEHLAKDVIRLHEPGAEMIGVGPFIPHSNTPLHGATGGTVERTLRLVAVLRLAFPDAHIPATTAMGILHPLGRERALQAGANVMMPNVTPTAQRAKYEIYPDKNCRSDNPVHCRGCIIMRILGLGRTIGTDHGHVKRVAETR